MKTLVTGIAVIALMTLPALGQDAPTSPATEKTPAAVTDSATLLSGDVSARALLHESVKNAANEMIGDINDVLIGGDGKITAVIVGVGGFLGMGEKNVALPFDQLTFSKVAGDDLLVTTAATKASLETAPEYIKPEDRN